MWKTWSFSSSRTHLTSLTILGLLPDLPSILHRKRIDFMILNINNKYSHLCCLLHHPFLLRGHLPASQASQSCWWWSFITKLIFILSINYINLLFPVQQRVARIHNHNPLFVWKVENFLSRCPFINGNLTSYLTVVKLANPISDNAYLPTIYLIVTIESYLNLLMTLLAPSSSTRSG